METIDRALPLAAGDPMTGSGLAFVCPRAHAYAHRGQCRGYMGELEQAHQDFDRGIELAHEHDDPETECAARATLALLEADVGDYEVALGNAALGLEIVDRSGNVIHIMACTVPAAAAEAGAGRFAEALAGAESNLATIREHGTGLYYEPVLLATIARSKLALGEAGDALAAAEEAVDITNERRFTTCALAAPIALAQVLIATDGAAAGERIDAVLAGAALARLRGDDVTAEREQAFPRSLRGS